MLMCDTNQHSFTVKTKVLENVTTAALSFTEKQKVLENITTVLPISELQMATDDNFLFKL